MQEQEVGWANGWTMLWLYSSRGSMHSNANFTVGRDLCERIVIGGMSVGKDTDPDGMAAQANSEVSALLGRIPSAVGYQPTLATDLGGLQERITSTHKGSITSVQVL